MGNECKVYFTNASKWIQLKSIELLRKAIDIIENVKAKAYLKFC